MLSVNLFGSPRLCVKDGSEQLSVHPSTLRLFAYLVLKPNQLARHAVAFALWPDDPEDVAYGKLRRHLYKLKSAFHAAGVSDSLIHADDSELRLNGGDALWIDTREFEREVRRSEASSAAADLYSADLLEGFSDEWIIVERERLRSLHTSNLVKLVLESRARREYARGIGYAQRLLEHEPWREDIVRQLMALRYESGDRGGAVHEYDEFARRLGQEMSAAPMPETRALLHAINRSEPTFDREALPKQSSASQVPATRGTPLVGRDDEMAFMRSVWQRAVAGHGGGLFIAGESGIGKTRLANELVALVEREGGRTLIGTTTSPEAWPYQALSGALRAGLPLLASADVDPIWLTVLSQLVPDIRVQRAELPIVTPLEKDREQRRLLDSVAKVLESVARPRPLLVILEDFHWAGTSSIAALDFLMRRAHSQRLLIVATYRTEEVPPDHPLFSVRRRLLREGIASQVEPTRFDASAVRALLESAAALERFGPGAAEWILAASEGNPLLAIQTISDLLESDALRFGGAGSADRGERPLVAAIERTIASRIARLTPHTRLLAEVAAAIGVGFDAETLVEVVGWTTDDVLNAVGELLDRRLVRESGEPAGHDYVFAHHLIQASIYAGIKQIDRRRRHHRIARVLERLTSDGADEQARFIAVHFELAGLGQTAAEHYMRAARAAFALFANDEAMALATKAHALAQEAATRFEALSLRADVEERLAERDAQRSDIAAMRSIAIALDNDGLMCRALSKQIALAHDLGEREAERQLIGELRAIAGRSESLTWLAAAARAEGRYETTGGDYTAARAHLESALAFYEQAQATDDVFDCLLQLFESARRHKNLALVQAQMDRLEAFAQRQSSRAVSLRVMECATGLSMLGTDFNIAADVAKRWLAEAESLDDVSAQARAHSMLWNIQSYLGNYDEAYRSAGKAAELFDRLGDRAGRARLLMDNTIVLIRSWKLDQAKAYVSQAYEVFREVDDAGAQLTALQRLTLIHCYAGEFAMAAEFGRRTLDLAKRVGSSYSVSLAYGNLGWAERELGHLDLALQYNSEAIATAREQNELANLLPYLNNRAEILLRVGDFEGAQSAMDECLALIEGRRSSMLFAHDNFFTAARVYRALGNHQRVAEFVSLGRAEVERIKKSLPNEDAVASFLAHRYNRRIIDAFEKDIWPPSGPQPGDKLPPKSLLSRALA